MVRSSHNLVWRPPKSNMSIIIIKFWHDSFHATYISLVWCSLVKLDLYISIKNWPPLQCTRVCFSCVESSYPWPWWLAGSRSLETDASPRSSIKNHFGTSYGQQQTDGCADFLVKIGSSLLVPTYLKMIISFEVNPFNIVIFSNWQIS